LQRLDNFADILAVSKRPRWRVRAEPEPMGPFKGACVEAMFDHVDEFSSAISTSLLDYRELRRT